MSINDGDSLRNIWQGHWLLFFFLRQTLTLQRCSVGYTQTPGYVISRSTDTMRYCMTQHLTTECNWKLGGAGSFTTNTGTSQWGNPGQFCILLSNCDKISYGDNEHFFHWAFLQILSMKLLTKDWSWTGELQRRDWPSPEWCRETKTSMEYKSTKPHTFIWSYAKTQR